MGLTNFRDHGVVGLRGRRRWAARPALRRSPCRHSMSPIATPVSAPTAARCASAFARQARSAIRSTGAGRSRSGKDA
jgi:hypothetical protein